MFEIKENYDKEKYPYVTQIEDQYGTILYHVEKSQKGYTPIAISYTNNNAHRSILGKDKRKKYYNKKEAIDIIKQHKQAIQN